LPARIITKALERAAKESKCDSFGLRLAEYRSFADLGPISLLMQHLSTPREVIHASVRYRRHFNDLLLVSIDDGDNESFITWDLFATYSAWQSIDLGLGLAYWLLTGSSGGRWAPTKVHLTHSTPVDTRTWERFFPCPVEFNCNRNGFTCARASLDVANPAANSIMAKHALDLLDLAPASESGDSVIEKTGRLIGLCLPEGKANLSVVSVHMELAPRTLQRMLDLEGASFSKLLDEVKLDLAKRYLRNASRPVSAVSDLLGYSSPAPFSRWFCDRTGKSPTHWRRQFQRNAEPSPIRRV
jgi:AraC-like DNA-binding protein